MSMVRWIMVCIFWGLGSGGIWEGIHHGGRIVFSLGMAGLLIGLAIMTEREWPS